MSATSICRALVDDLVLLTDVMIRKGSQINFSSGGVAFSTVPVVSRSA